MLISRSEGGTRRLLYANAAFYQLAHCNPSEIVGKDWPALLQSERQRTDVLDRIEATEGSGLHDVLRVRDQGGTVQWLNVVSYPLPPNQPGMADFVTILQNVTTEHAYRDRLKHRALYDALTGVPNRYLFEDRFARLRANTSRHGNTFVLVLLDLNGFKAINDRFGHPAGDEVLRCVAARLDAAARGIDTVARLGGDEFALLLADTDCTGTLQPILTRLLAALERPILVMGQSIHLSASSGYAQFPNDGTSLDALLSIADRALYEAKSGRSERRD